MLILSNRSVLLVAAMGCGMSFGFGCSNAASPVPDASPLLDSANLDGRSGDAALDAAAPRGGLVLNEVAASGTPEDWFEVTNVGPTSIVLSDYCFVDVKDDFVKCKAFEATVLAPGAHLAFDVTTVGSGFKLGSDEELWIYRNADKVLIDGIDWAEGQSPATGSFARVPDATGPFMMVAAATRGATN